MKQFYKDGACRKIRPPFTSCRFLFQYIVSPWVRISIKSNTHIFFCFCHALFVEKFYLFFVTFLPCNFKRSQVKISKYIVKILKVFFQALENISTYFYNFLCRFSTNTTQYMVYVSLFECADSFCQNLFKFFCPFEWLLYDVLNLKWHTTPKIRNMK